MALYAIGDVQGCREALEDLLTLIRFDPARDRLWFAGDLVARGPDSLGVLRLVKSLGPAAESVLGNHDLHLLAAHYGLSKPKARDLTQAIFNAPDRAELMAWIRQRPLCLEDEALDCILTHAGIPPGWSCKQTRKRAREVEAALQSPDIESFLGDMYGNEPAVWNSNLEGTTRLRVITNFLTRMRLVDLDGRMDFAYKEDLTAIPPGLHPWFSLPNPATGSTRILFGHWAAIAGATEHPRIIGLDTGCVWGGCLTAYRVDDGKSFSSSRGCVAAAGFSD
ncbi:MAG: symmetrical bis(5'-nucleosyl)-tetraphosphatase [Moraxellaceae bacterium]